MSLSSGNIELQAYCTVSTLNFTKYHFLRKTGRKFVVNHHHEKICNILDDVIDGKITKLIINIAPRYSKTELAVKNFIAYGLQINPSSKYIHLSYSDDLAIDNSEEIREIVKSEAYQDLFPYVQISKSSDSKKKWYTTEGGGVYATSTGGQVTGFGAGEVDSDDNDEELSEDIRLFLNGNNAEKESDTEKFAGAIIIDDPIKPEDALSDTKREAVNRRFESTIRNRVNSRKTPIIIIMQRLHDNDLCGYLMELEPGEWVVLSLPCVYKDDKGEEKALWEHKHSLKELKQIEKNDSYVFNTQYMQDPSPVEGLLFPVSELRFEDFSRVDFSKASYSFSIGDPADKGGDFYAMPFCFVMCNDNDLSVFTKRVVFNKHGVEANTERIRDIVKDENIEQVLIESNGGWVSSAILLKKILDNQTKVSPYSVSINKLVRILSNYEFIKRHFVFDINYKLDQDYNDFIKNLTSFLKEGDNKNDDAPDVMAAASSVVKVKYKSFLYG